MKLTQGYFTGLRLIGGAVVAICALLTIAACDQPERTVTTQPASSVAQALIITNTPTKEPSKSDGWDEFRKQREQWQTMIALTPTQPRPTWPPLGPTPTWQLGMLECANANAHDYQLTSCWRGVVNGKVISAACVIEGYGEEPGDPSKAYVIIFDGPLFYPFNYVYEVPAKLGGWYIVSVEGSRLNLAPMKPQTIQTSLVFDLVTRQFGASSGTPIPTTPAPTATP
jgi:hypothetical protein